MEQRRDEGVCAESCDSLQLLLEDNVDAKAAMACCQTIDDSLGKAISEHDALMKRLGEKQPGGK